LAVLYTLLILLTVFLVVAGVFVFTKLRLIISVGNNGLMLKLVKFGFSFTIPLDRIKKKSKNIKPEDEEKIKQLNKEDSIMKKFFDMRNNFMRQKKALTEVFSYLKGKIFLHEIGIIGKFGTGSPASGGMAYGTVCSFINGVTAFFANFFVLEKSPVINVEFKPQEAIIEIKAAFLIDAKPYSIIKAFIIYKNILKKGE